MSKRSPAQKSYGDVPLPSSTDSEKAVLGCLLVHNQMIDNVLEIISPDMMYHPKNQLVFESIIRLHNKNDPIDQVTVCEDLTAHGLLPSKVENWEVANLVSDPGGPTFAESYATHVRDDHIRRSVAERASLVHRDAMNKSIPVDELLSNASSISTNLDINAGEYVMIGDMAEKALERAVKAAEKPGVITGFPSGNRRLDDITDGFQRSDQIILAGRPGMGKSAVAWDLAKSVAKEGTPVLWINLEMSNLQIGNRALASFAEVDSHKMRRGYLGETDFGKLPGAKEELKGLPVYLDEKSRTLEEVNASIRKAVKKFNVGFVVTDYLQLVQPPRDSYGQREQDVAQISASLKAGAKRQNICHMLLSQLSRALESRKDKRPILSDLRESGSIEQDADMVGFLYRDSYYQEEEYEDKDSLEIIIAKQRNGPTGKVTVTFDLKTGRMSER